MIDALPANPRITLLAGGVGACRLLRGLAEVVDPRRLTVIVNTGDDESFYGLQVSPDLDTVAYTLAGLAPIKRGWGIRGDTRNALPWLGRYFGDQWFSLGDQDLALHIYRSHLLREGSSLAQATRRICTQLGIRTSVLPMSNDPVRTVLRSGRRRFAFQEWFVKQGARPRVDGITYKGASGASMAPGVIEALVSADRVIIAPSNPYVSIAPMLAIPGLRPALAAVCHKTIAVSPLVNGRAVKGPLVAMMKSLGAGRGSAGIADFYEGLATSLVVSPGDAPRRPEATWPRLLERNTLLDSKRRSLALARFLLKIPLEGTDS